MRARSSSRTSCDTSKRPGASSGVSPADPTAAEGSREQRMNAYRAVRDQLLARIRARFGTPRGGNE